MQDIIFFCYYCLNHKHIVTTCKMYVDASKDYRYIFYSILSSCKYFLDKK